MARVRNKIKDRFWARVLKLHNDCWEWQGYCFNTGYGGFDFKGKTMLAHRMAWFFHTGRHPRKWILHKCDNRKCVNPRHLYCGTPKDNVGDMVRRSRQAKGNKIWSSKLNPKLVREIQGFKKVKCRCTASKISEIYGVSKTTIYGIWSGKFWKYL